MKKIISALVSAAFLASPMLVISTSASATTTVAPTSTASSFKVDAKRSGKKGMKRGAKKAKAA